MDKLMMKLNFWLCSGLISWSDASNIYSCVWWHSAEYICMLRTYYQSSHWNVALTRPNVSTSFLPPHQSPVSQTSLRKLEQLVKAWSAGAAGAAYSTVQAVRLWRWLSLLQTHLLLGGWRKLLLSYGVKSWMLQHCGVEASYLQTKIKRHTTITM